MLHRLMGQDPQRGLAPILSTLGSKYVKAPGSQPLLLHACDFGCVGNSCSGRYGHGSTTNGTILGVGEFTTHFRTYLDWDVHWGLTDLGFDPWPYLCVVCRPLLFCLFGLKGWQGKADRRGNLIGFHFRGAHETASRHTALPGWETLSMPRCAKQVNQRLRLFRVAFWN